MAVTPRPPASSFTTRIDNPFMPLKFGTTFVSRATSEDFTDTATVTRETKVIDGVRCVVLHVVERIDGKVTQVTDDYFAQDRQGNVWMFGEDTFEPGRPGDPTAGSWRAGVDGALAGIAMLANPKTGDIHHLEFLPGVAEDMSINTHTNQAVSTAYGTFNSALGILSFTPLENHVENKYYVPGVGLVLTTDRDGLFQEVVRILVNGTSGNDRLTAYAGGDKISGFAGNDTLSGLAGNDTINGGTGRDVMWGGVGDDTYVVDNARDTVNERAGGGVDRVVSSITEALSANVENLKLIGARAVNGIGNELDNVIVGNGAANVLSGLGGNDKLFSGLGDDVLRGGLGLDFLFGGAGADSFQFNSQAESVQGTADLICDFSRGQGDRIDIHSIDANALIAGDQAFSFIGTAAFSADTSGAGQLRYFESGGRTIVEGNTNADAAAEFQVQVIGNIPNLVSDFIL